jgi:chromate transport protein ChrA
VVTPSVVVVVVVEIVVSLGADASVTEFVTSGIVAVVVGIVSGAELGAGSGSLVSDPSKTVGLELAIESAPNNNSSVFNSVPMFRL